MNITYKHDANGGFTVKLANSNISCYAYPTSIGAIKARKNPEKVAREMMTAELAFLPTAVEVLGYRRAVLRDQTLTYENRYLIRERE